MSDEQTTQSDIPVNLPSVDNQDRKQLEKKERLSRLAPFMWKAGQSGNPAGRPVGKTAKERAKELIKTMSEVEFQQFLHGMPKTEIWKMAEGNPETKTDITTLGRAINTITPQDIALAEQLSKLENPNASDTGTSEPSAGSVAGLVGSEVSDKERGGSPA